MLEKEQVEEAVAAVLALLKVKDDVVNIVDQPQKIDIQFTLKHIPKLSHKSIHIDLPNPIHFESREVCIFVKDLNQKSREYEATVQHYEDIFRKHNIDTISKIVPVKALRTDYSLPSSKTSLAKAYDLYLADACVLGLLPGILGKIFYAKKKTIPVKVNLSAKGLKPEIDRVVDNTRCVLQGTGSSSSVMVAHDKMSKAEIVSNILAACNMLVEKLPGGKENIRNMYIKGSDTAAVPVFIDLESANTVELPEVKPDAIATYVDDITPVEGGQMMVRADGYVQFIKDKKAVKKEEKQDVDSDTEEIEQENKESDIEVSDDEEDKDDVQIEISKNKKKGKSAKSPKKRVNEEKDEDIVKKKKQKQTEIAATKQSGKSSKKGKKARKV